MARYIDGFVIPVPKRNLTAYKHMSRKAGRIWLEHGALEFRETVAEDAAPEGAVPFARVARSKPGEVVVFSYTAFRSRAHRDRVNARVMKDPRVLAMMQEQEMPFDAKRMVYGGFSVMIDLSAG